MAFTADRPGFAALGRLLAGGTLRLIAGSEDNLNEIAEVMLQDEMEDVSLRLASLPPAERKVWRARAKAALIGLDKVVARASK